MQTYQKGQKQSTNYSCTELNKTVFPVSIVNIVWLKIAIKPLMMPLLNIQDDFISHIVNLLKEKRKEIFSVYID